MKSFFLTCLNIEDWSFEAVNVVLLLGSESFEHCYFVYFTSLFIEIDVKK